MMTMAVPQTKKRSFFLQCLAISVGLHAAGLIYLNDHPMILHGPDLSLFGQSSAKPTPLQEDEESVMQRHLEEVFKEIVVLSPHFQQPYDLIELPKGVPMAPTREEVAISPPMGAQENPFSTTLSSYCSYTQPIMDPMEELDIPLFFEAPQPPSSLATHLQFDTENALSDIPFSLTLPLQAMTLEDLIPQHNVALHAQPKTESAPNFSYELTALDIPEVKISEESKTLTERLSKEDLSSENNQENTALLTPNAPELSPPNTGAQFAASPSELEHYKFPLLASAAEWNDDFDLDISFMPNPEGEGYIFSLTVKPNCDLSAHSLKQNLYFIIDRSSTIQKHRFAVFKRAVVKALASMTKGDTFNILMMDKKIIRFSPKNQLATLKNIQAAEEFLEKQESGGFLAFADIYNKIDQILPYIPENDEVHTAILLTDGKTNLKTERKQKVLKNWVNKNRGRVSLYAAAVGRDNDLISLDMLCNLSGGKLLYSDTHASLPRKLSKLILDMKDPIAKDLIITAIPKNPDAHIELFSTKSQLLSLYSHQPYVIIGQIDEPCNFDLIIQGRHRDEWIALKKSVSFVDGHKGDRTLEKQWEDKRVNTCYSNFLEDAKSAYLKDVKNIFKRSRPEVAQQ